jgi:hypothetical protein
MDIGLMKDNIKEQLAYIKTLDKAIDAIKMDVDKIIDGSEDIKKILNEMHKQGYEARVIFSAEISVKCKDSFWTKDDKDFLKRLNISLL